MQHTAMNMIDVASKLLLDIQTFQTRPINNCIYIISLSLDLIYSDHMAHVAFPLIFTATVLVKARFDWIWMELVSSDQCHWIHYRILLDQVITYK